MILSLNGLAPWRNATVICVGVFTLLHTSGCGSSGSSSGPDPVTSLTPVTATITAAGTELVEGSSDEVDIWVDLNPQVNRNVSISLGFDGTATRNLDYEIDEHVLSFSPNQSRATTRLRALDDWLPEDTESLTIRLAEFSAATSAGLQSTVTFALEDNLDAPLTKADKLGGGDLFVRLSSSFNQETATIEVRVINRGAASSSATDGYVRSFRLARPGELDRTSVEQIEIEVPPIDARSSFHTDATLDLRKYTPYETYWVEASVTPPPEERFGGALPNRHIRGFTLNETGEILTRCIAPNRVRSSEGGDPLLESQWPLRNVGQTAFAENGGKAEEDLRMNDVLATGEPTGIGVNVAVVDTGLEICHPDLAENVVQGGSFNFKINAEETESWFNVDAFDPYFPGARGDHGTSVAGIIGARAENGLGLRGVAPDASLFGFNYLSEQCCLEDALGGSAEAPNSQQIDVFNMSFGSLGSQYYELADGILRYGTSELRDSLGAIYVKSAGNGFRLCTHFMHQVHTTVGCNSSNGDRLNNLPYVIAVGALNAAGARASYSSVGSNLWISAPAGEYGVREPATITTDQFGRNRGYSSRGSPGITSDENADPFGDYSSNFNGTSAAAPHVSGVVALLLEVEPNLTWRDVKHILARTARRPGGLLNPITDVRVVIGDQLVTISQDWVTNAAGFDFHNHFGFGVVDVDAAIALVREDYEPDSLGTQIRSDWFTTSSDGLQIPDHDGSGIEQQLNLDLPARANIEAVQLHIAGSHENLVDLSIQLTSPSGTQSILNPVFNEVLTGNTTLDWRLLSNAFYGESPRGAWTLHVVDAAETDVGTLSSWALRVWYGEHP